ncbi:MAG: O-antigen ligase family protein, partial [Pyrinomonadaceae bacterium]
LLSVNAIGDYQSGNLVVEGYRIRGLLGGMFGNPNDLALHFVTMAPLAVGLMMASRNLLGKLLFGVIAVMAVAAITVTYSRAGFIGLLAIASVLLWKLGRRHRLRIAILGPICLTLFIAFAPGNYANRILSIFIPSLDAMGSRSHRQEILNRSVLVSLRWPITGVGMGNFAAVSLGETVTHNAFTQVSAEMGITALVVYMMFLTGPLRGLRRMERETFNLRPQTHYYYLAIGLQVSLIGYMVSGFFASVAYQWYAYYLVGYAVCLRRMYEADERTSTEITAQAASPPVADQHVGRHHAPALWPPGTRHSSLR